MKREISKEDRHTSHYLNSYCIKNLKEYTPFFEYNYDTFKIEYDELISNSINLGKVIKVEDIENLNIVELIKKLQLT